MRPHLLLFVTVVLWGWTFVATKVLLLELDPLHIVLARLVVGVPTLSVLLVVRRVSLRFSRADVLPVLVGSGIYTLHLLIQVAGLATTTAINTGWIISVTPLVLALMSYAWLGERIGGRGIVGIAIATIGILLLVSGGRLGSLAWLRNTGDWLVLLSAHTWALYTVATRNLVRRRHPLAVTFGILLATAIFALLLALARGPIVMPPLSARALAALLYLAIAGQVLGQWFWQEGVARIGASRAGLYLYLEPLATLMLAIPLLGEEANVATAIGGGLILVGVYVGQRGASSPGKAG